MEQGEILVRPLSMRSFRRDLDKFEKYIAKVTMQESDASVDEKRQRINENLRYEPFCERIRKYFGPDIKTEDVKAIYRKISTNPEIKIDWSEVFGYFQAEIEDDGDEISVFTVSKRKKIGEAAGDKKRRDIIQCITYSPEYDIYVTASQKGALAIYNGKLRLQSCIDVNATTERTIVVWDHRAKANNQSSIYVIKPLEHSPQCMCLLPPKDDHTDAVLIGDDAGFVNLVKFTPNDFTSNTSNDPSRAMTSQVIDSTSLMIPIVRRKFHPDWVLKVEYLPDLKSFASCSPSDKNSFVISEFKRLFDTQPVSELSIAKGVNSFAYSEKSNIFATGGVDKIIRVWHPNILSRPTGKMIGHLFTVIAVVINDKDQHIISLSTARVFRVWDIHTLMCLQVFTESEQKSGDRRISCMLFDSRHDRLFTGSSSIDMWPMTRTVQDTMSVPHTHDHPLSVLAKNKAMNQAVTACSESIIKVWEVDTGRQMYQISEAHGMGTEVTSAAVDPTGTRMASGGYDGSIKIWEFSSGQELKSYSLDPPRDDDETVSWMAYLPDSTIGLDSQDVATDKIAAAQNEDPRNGNDMIDKEGQVAKRRILAVGWNNKLKEFEDTSDDSSQLVFVREFDSIYEWPPTPEVSPEPEEFVDDPEKQEEVITKKKPRAEEEEPILRKEHLLLRHEMTCCSLMDDSVKSVADILVTGCSNGNLIIWNHQKGGVENVFELEKAELPSRYDSRERRMKEQLPYRVNAVTGLCHRVFRPDPEELKRRRKLRKKKLQEMEEGTVGNDDAEQQEGEEEQVHTSEESDEQGEVFDDPAEEMDVPTGSDVDDEEDDIKSFEERQLIEFDQEPIKMVRVDFPPVIASCHQDCNVRLWSMSGDLMLSLSPMTKVASPLTCMCTDENAEFLIVGDTKGYVTMWNLSEFLQRSPTSPIATSGELARQIISWRAHLLKIVAVSYVDDSAALITASADGSVRIWYPRRSHYIGYFGQQRVWYLVPNPTLPSSPVMPYDISEAPIKPINVKSNRKKTQTKKYNYPLIFDTNKWKPFRRSAYDREVTQMQSVVSSKDQLANVLEVRNKKFFTALVKPKPDKSSLESSKPAEPESGAIFRALPVYRLKTPPPQPELPSLDIITGGSSWNDDENSNPKTPGKSGGLKGPRGRGPSRKVAPVVGGLSTFTTGTPKKRR